MLFGVDIPVIQSLILDLNLQELIEGVQILDRKCLKILRILITSLHLLQKMLEFALIKMLSG